MEDEPFVSPKRGYRLPKSRLTPLQREKSRFDASVASKTQLNLLRLTLLRIDVSK